jgi:hypothetical protein
MGYASVRLVQNGARLTNLQILGRPIRAGDTVIVDYASGDNPVVRPLTIATEIPGETHEFAEIVPPVEKDDGQQLLLEPTWFPVMGKISAYSNQSFSAGFTPTGEEYGTSKTWGKTIYDTNKQGTTDGFTCKVPGKYHFSFTIAISPVACASVPGMVISFVDDISTPTENITLRTYRRIYNSPLTTIIHGTAIKCAQQGDKFRFFMQGRPYGVWQDENDSFEITLTSPAAARYPILEWWRIGPNIGTQSLPQWYW